MMKMMVNGTEYKVKFGYNCFCDTDLMDRVNDLTRLFSENNTDGDTAVSSLGKIKELFQVVRDLLFVGFKKYNPVETVQVIGDILDEYMDDEAKEKRGLFYLFSELSEELFSAGFLSDLITGETANGMKNGAKAPMDHNPKK